MNSKSMNGQAAVMLSLVVQSASLRGRPLPSSLSMQASEFYFNDTQQCILEDDNDSSTQLPSSGSSRGACRTRKFIHTWDTATLANFFFPNYWSQVRGSGIYMSAALSRAYTVNHSLWASFPLIQVNHNTPPVGQLSYDRIGIFSRPPMFLWFFIQIVVYLCNLRKIYINQINIHSSSTTKDLAFCTSRKKKFMVAWHIQGVFFDIPR